MFYLPNDLGNRSFRVLLPNYGEVLKLMLPNYTRKIISGWSNYSCKVTMHKIIEKLMGYRVSKSEIIAAMLQCCSACTLIRCYAALLRPLVFGLRPSEEMPSVKEQRVDGSWHSIILCLRCTLRGLKINLSIRILSNQIKIKFFFTSNFHLYDKSESLVWSNVIVRWIFI
jgi:hypothetical protein